MMYIPENKWSYQKLDEVDPESKNAIMYFTLLWGLFEAKFCNESAGAKSIYDECKKIEIFLNKSDFEEYLDYFQKRYISKGTVNNKFKSLKFRANNKQPLIEKVLKSETDSVVDIVSAMLIIVYRLRNNLFHGLKWQYDIQGQYSNFDMSNQLLIKMLSIIDNRS